MKLLSALLSVAGVSGLVWVCPVGAEEQRSRGVEVVRAEGAEAAEEAEEAVKNTAADLLAQGNLTRVTGIEIDRTELGLEVILETAAGSERLVPLILPEGNDLVIDILDATLGFELRNGVTELNPAPGIEQVQLTKVDESSIRLTITGESQTPNAEIVPSRQNLVLSVTPEQTTAQEDEPTEEIDIIVTSTTVGTRTETNLQEVPQSVQIIPQETLEQREINNFNEAFRNIPGIVSSFDTAFFNTPNVRGFVADFRRNGLRADVFGFTGEQTANVERLEILKGPASVLYGQGSFGGTVNIITKQPTDEPFYEIDAAIGSFDLYRGAVDLSGPLNESKSLKYRLNIAAETEGSFVDFLDRDRFLIAPVISWQIGENTDITFEAEYYILNFETFNGLPARGTILDNINGEIDRDRFANDPERGREFDTIIVGYDLEHRFNDNWRIRNAFQFGNSLNSGDFLFPTNLQEDDRSLEFGLSDTEKFDTYSYLLDTYVVGNFNTGSIKHELLVGVELSRSEQYNDFIIGEVTPLDLFDPNYDSLVVQPNPDLFQEEIIDQTLGIYLQDKIEFTDSLILLAGGRFDIVNTDIENLAEQTSDFQQEEEFSPRVGIVYKVIPEVSLYASYSRSFVPNFGEISEDGELFEPRRGTQYEIGAKAELNEKISVTLAYFDTTITNVPTSDLNGVFSVITGEQNSKGVELFATGEILPGWNVIGGYTYNDASIFYNRDGLRAALNFRNLFDIEYFENAGNSLRVRYGEPFTVIGSLSYEF